MLLGHYAYKCTDERIRNAGLWPFSLVPRSPGCCGRPIRLSPSWLRGSWSRRLSLSGCSRWGRGWTSYLPTRSSGSFFSWKRELVIVVGIGGNESIRAVVCIAIVIPIVFVTVFGIAIGIGIVVDIGIIISNIIGIIIDIVIDIVFFFYRIRYRNLYRNRSRYRFRYQQRYGSVSLRYRCRHRYHYRCRHRYRCRYTYPYPFV